MAAPYDIPEAVEGAGAPAADFNAARAAILDLDANRAPKVYADIAEVDAVADSEIGLVYLSDIGDALGYVALGGQEGTLIVSTTKLIYTDGGYIGMAQVFSGVLDPWAGGYIELTRIRWSDSGPWGLASDKPIPSVYYDQFATLALVHQQNTTTQLDASTYANSGSGRLLRVSANWRTYTGLTELPETLSIMAYGKEVAYSTPAAEIALVQTFEVVSTSGPVTVYRSRVRDTSFVWGSWTSWALA